MVRVLLTCLLLFGFDSQLRAEPPSVSSLFPAGAQRGHTVEVKLNGKAGTAPLQFWCDLPEITAEFPEKPNDVVKLTIPPETVPGVALIRVANSEGASALRPFVIGTLPEINETEPNDSVEQTEKIDTTQFIYNGVLGKSGDVDTFSVTLKAGQTLVVAMSSAEPFGSPLDGILQIASSDGFVLEQNDDERGNDPLIAFQVPRDATYLVRAFGFPATPNSTIRFAGGGDYVYRLTVTTGAFVDHSQPMAANPASDTELKLVGWNLSDGLKLKAINDSIVWDANLGNALELPQAATNNVVEKDRAEAAPQDVPFPATITGCIEKPGEVDRYEFVGKKGTKLNIQAEARAIGSPHDPVIRLTDANGKELKSADDRSRGELDCTLEYTLKADGKYRLQIFDRFEHASFRHVYRLTLDETRPAFNVSLAGDAFVLAEDKELEIPVTIERLGGFDQVLEVKLAELPAGVVCEPVKSEAKGDSAKKVTLMLKRGEGVEAYSGPLAIIAHPVEQADNTKTATVKVAGTSRESSHVWLTIPVKEKEPESGSK